MDLNFWQKRWEDNEIGFHEGRANKFLVKYFEKLSIAQGGRIFVPLCGKTRDMNWLLSQGYQVVGVELVETAVEQFFSEQKVTPQVIQKGSLKCYQAENIDIFVGDLFLLSPSLIEKVDAIYDRAALVALEEEVRIRYSQHLMKLTHYAPQLIVTFNYDQEEMPGPPFSISEEEIKRHYGEKYTFNLIEKTSVPGKLKGKCEANECVWLLKIKD